MRELRVVALYVYPLKSGRPVARTRLHFGPRGARHDREFMLVEPDGGRFVTGRKHFELPRTSVWVDEARASFSHPRAPANLQLDLSAAASASRRASRRPPRRVEVWGEAIEAEDMGEAAASWFTELLGLPLRLVRRHPGAQRPVDPDYDPEARGDAGFTDGFPLLAAHLPSLRALNARRVDAGHRPIDLLRYRPNLVLDGGEAWEEDEWRELEGPSARLAAVKPCTRCVMTTVDPQGGPRTPELIGQLRQLRTDLTFGVNLLPAGDAGQIDLGDRLRAYADS